MATEVTLPELGESVTEGTVTRWLKQVGDAVAMDEPLLEVSTDKVDTEIPSPVAGTLLEIKAQEDDTVEVGGLLAVIGDESEGGGSADSGADSSAEEDAAEAADEATEEPAAEADEPAQEAPAEEAPAEQQAPAAESKPAQGGSGTEVKLPELGESVTEGTVTRWLKDVGDEVAVDEALLEVSTDKVDTEIPSPVAGTLLEQRVAEDETVEVGAVLGIIGDGSAAPAEQEEPKQEEAPTQEQPAQEEAPAPEQPAEQPKQEEAAPQQEAPKPAASGNEDAGYVTPLVRKLANQHGVDLSTVTGSGVGGRIRKQDVLDAAKAQEAPAAPAPAPAASAAPAATPAPAQPSPLRGKTEPMTRLRKVIAKRMVESLQISAQLTQVVEVDVTNVARLRDQVKADFHSREGVKLSFFPFFAKATIDALKAHPALNAQVDAEKSEITYFDAEHLAIAVDTERGLLSPVIHNAGDLNVAGLARKIADLADRTRNNKVKPDELAGGTFTLTNTGSVGALFDTPIINQPQVAILGTGAVVKRAVVIDDPNLGETIAVRHMAYLSLTYDHRIVDGADAARFLQDVKQRVESGAFEV
ncbi:2-oxoglutarate dehydrogenase, E2 component, dihydrolipoamide succinyltransferase [Nocardioides sp. AE5]|uniref:2-oxoglutarate dehydrogenase, E2 component, dihydrolipoamide succinyltransferase n=1 Tax=Nocardioides sp. AE5 TaxID=2962573 RepID=UPI002882767E|nr:2-oxoglutarate dehydrogenase, E2 component, dihydrolipoamide succinyltransferase [Nocardioides sp. AE5]MDT0201754.1 2-oxoglutarate dehydrogenase, E2 component, dihydrolipoamide succinyltransferase [Nocardioides sp. AE5]